MAAVTLLAVANGAGDVITAFVASVDKGGLEYNIGAIFGAGMFVCSVVVAITIFLSETDIQLEPSSIWRDVGLYIIATLTILVFAMIGTLTWVSAVILILQYIMLIVIVIVQERLSGNDENSQDNEENPNKNLILFEDVKSDNYIKNVNNQSKWKKPLEVYHKNDYAKKFRILVLTMVFKERLKQAREQRVYFT